MPHLSISGLCKAFGKKKLLDGLDLAVERGECLVVFGGPGSGKPTLLRHIAGLLEPDAGTVLIDGQRAGDVSAQQRGVAMAFQNFALYPHMRLSRTSPPRCARAPLTRPGSPGRCRRWPNCCASRMCATTAPGSCPTGKSSAPRWRAAWCTSRR